MTRILVLTERELRSTVQLTLDAVDCVEDAFAALSSGEVAMPPVLRLDIPSHRGEVDVKTAYIPGFESFAIKISPGFFNNPKLGLPSTNGMMVLLSSTTGLVQALLLDNGYLTDIRTAAAGAVAARHLARKDAAVAAVYGAGMQARLQLEALTLVRPITQARLWARDHSQARAVAGELTSHLGFPVIAHADPAHAARGADVLVTTTPAESPIFKTDWLEPGQHLTAMGSDAEHKNEIEPSALGSVDVYVADSLSQTALLGELNHALSAGLVIEHGHDLSQVIVDANTGRSSDEQITLADLTGTGVQDTAIALFARSKAIAAVTGSYIEA